MKFIHLDEQPKEDILRQLILGGRQRGKRYKLKELTKRGNKMNFIEAYRAITEGKKVKQSYWDDGAYVHKDVCCTYNIDAPCVVDKDGNKYKFDAHDYRNEWELYEEKPKLHTFEEALAAYKKGKKIRRAEYDVFHWISIPRGNNHFTKIWATDMLKKDWLIEGEDDK